MAKFEFSIRYYGNAVEDGRIPIKELAPSLLALSEALQSSQEITNPSEDSVSLDIKATEKGSFIVDLILANGSDLLSKTIDLLTGKESDAALNLMTYIGTFYGAITFLKAKKHKKIKEEKELNEKDVKITFDDNTSIEIPKNALKASKNVDFRKSVKEFVEPLNENGIDGIQLKSQIEYNLSLEIKSNEVKYFEVPEIKEKELDVSTTEVFLRIVNVAFENGKWRFDNGSNSFFARITDETFIKEVENNNIQFGSTDVLKVELETSQYLNKEGSLKSEYTVLKVLDHIKGSKQLELDL
ncbi:hypothetical protein P7H62_12835 [Vagococcus carniphilus]|uniref:hypothetical protein n=1 Tax=Vagococcus carniphilus TaxID=218144 RepID=UPI00288DF0EF|nr:hypothetical protein [Vagococcus carniphilus]MDT2831835.1 hypothetical protein [Vagococcus carniphilus]MDT2855345.1 hypothetical protein [Vagococcus carniphilus]